MTRWITGILLSVATVLLLLYVPPFYLKFIVGILAGIACWEFLSLTVRDGVWTKVAGIFLVTTGCNFFSLGVDRFWVFAFVFLVLLVGFVTQFPGPRESSEKIRNTAFFCLGIFYCTFLFAFLGLLTDRPHHRFWLFLTLGATSVADTGAYLVGRAFGRHKLAPALSPGKTVEGVLGALIGGVAAAIVMRQIFWPQFPPVPAGLLGLLIAVFGIFGDLCESLLKRGFHVKDSSSLVPGHGGLLDRVDALLFTAPMVYIVSNFV